jgi:hypothetical protein
MPKELGASGDRRPDNRGAGSYLSLAMAQRLISLNPSSL